MLNCDVVCDLVILYASGEASEATRQVVEEHLPHCPECQEILEQVQNAETALASFKEEAVPEDGRRFLTRLRQFIFTAGAGTLFLASFGLAMTSQLLFRNFGIPVVQTAIPSLAPIWQLLGIASLAAAVLSQRQNKLRLPGKANRIVTAEALAVLPLAIFSFTAYAVISAGHLLGTLLFGLLLIGAYRMVLSWRQLRPDSVWNLLEAGGLLLALVAAAFNAVLLGGVASALIAGILAAAALTITLARVPGLTHITLPTLLILFLGAILLSGRIGLSIATLIEHSLALPQPPAGMTVRQAAQPDLGQLGFTLEASQGVNQINNVPVGEGAEGIRSTYTRLDRQLFLTAIRFEQLPAAYENFGTWLTSVPADMWVLEIPERTIGGGRVAYGYDGTNERAYAAWHSGNWVIFIEVPGLYTEAAPLSLRAKEALVHHFR